MILKQVWIKLTGFRKLKKTMDSHAFGAGIQYDADIQKNIIELINNKVPFYKWDTYHYAILYQAFSLFGNKKECEQGKRLKYHLGINKYIHIPEKLYFDDESVRLINQVRLNLMGAVKFNACKAINYHS